MIANGFWFACGIALFLLVPFIVVGVLAIPFSIIEYVAEKREDKKKTKELIAKGADPNTFFVKGGIIYQKENKNCIKDKTR